MTASARVPSEIRPDSERFGALYAAHFRVVWRTLQRLGVFPAFVDDAAQEVFVTAWRRWSEFEGRSSERTWLLGIALRVASDVRRKQRPSDEVPLKLASEAATPDVVTAAREKSKRVEALLKQLDDERREVLLLCDVEGYTIPEVAEATGTNLNTLYTRLRTARQQFEALVKREREEL
ncbi:MAG: RNA polymerase sigma factor [Archangium sp.]